MIRSSTLQSREGLSTIVVEFSNPVKQLHQLRLCTATWYSTLESRVTERLK